MNTTALIKHKKLLSPIIQSCFDNQGKYLIDKSGNILLNNDKHLSFSLTADTNLLAFLGEHDVIISTHHLSQLATKKEPQTFEFSYKNSEEQTNNHYKLLLSFCGDDALQIFMVAMIDETSFFNLQQKQQKQLDRLESEIILRTREIMNTKEVMDLQGGYLHNFLKGLRHDLLSPITQLKEIIAYYKKTDDIAKKEKAASLIDDSLRKLSNTASGFSDFVDIHILDRSHKEACDFNVIFNEIKSLLKNEIEIAKATFVVDFEEINMIKFNRKELTSILHNLLSNALKFRDLNRELKINLQTKLTDKHIVISIEDNGIGMDYKKYKDQLFKPFKRMNATQPGAGIGLSLVKHMLDKNDGLIRMESEVGTGMKVRILLPVDLVVSRPTLAELQNK